MRRILRKVAADDYADLGDTSTLADPSVTDALINNRMNRQWLLNFIWQKNAVEIKNIKKIKKYIYKLSI